jgi:hypothetical protein
MDSFEIIMRSANLYSYYVDPSSFPVVLLERWQKAEVCNRRAVKINIIMKYEDGAIILVHSLRF